MWPHRAQRLRRPPRRDACAGRSDTSSASLTSPITHSMPSRRETGMDARVVSGRSHVPHRTPSSFLQISRTRLIVCLIALGPMSLSAHLLHEAKIASPAAAPQNTAHARDGQHDFDFEFGTWKAHLKRLLKPLSGSDTWVEYEGTSILRKVWDGRANLGEFTATGAAGRIEGLSLRLYHPEARQWSIYWANSRDGSLGTPMIGRFAAGRGEFFNQELFEGAPVFVRFVFSDITPTSFRLEQSFSADGGKTWEPNWIVAFTREKP